MMVWVRAPQREPGRAGWGELSFAAPTVDLPAERVQFFSSLSYILTLTHRPRPTQFSARHRAALEAYVHRLIWIGRRPMRALCFMRIVTCRQKPIRRQQFCHTEYIKNYRTQKGTSSGRATERTFYSEILMAILPHLREFMQSSALPQSSRAKVSVTRPSSLILPDSRYSTARGKQ